MKESSFLSYFVSCANKMGISLQNLKKKNSDKKITTFSTGKVVIVLQPIEKFNRKRFFNF